MRHSLLYAISLFAVVSSTSAIASMTAKEVFQRYSDAVVVVKNGNLTHTVQGSGVYISIDMFGKERKAVVTNLHVVRGVRPLEKVHLRSGSYNFIGTLTSTDYFADLAIIVVDQETKLHPIKVTSNSGQVTIGERVFAIGAPRQLEKTITEGIVSGVRRKGGSLNLIQATAPISPGSSGGMLIGDNGELIGITTFTLRESQQINFSVSSEYVYRAFRSEVSRFFAANAFKALSDQIPSFNNALSILYSPNFLPRTLNCKSTSDGKYLDEHLHQTADMMSTWPSDAIILVAFPAANYAADLLTLNVDDCLK